VKQFESPVNLVVAFCRLSAIHDTLEEKLSGIGYDGALSSRCSHLSLNGQGFMSQTRLEPEDRVPHAIPTRCYWDAVVGGLV
jgi:hypothetical protein